MAVIIVPVTIPAGETVGVAEIIPASGRGGGGQFYFAAIQNLDTGPYVPHVGVTGPPLRRVIVELPEAAAADITYHVAVLQV